MNENIDIVKRRIKKLLALSNFQQERKQDESHTAVWKKK